MLKDGLKRLKEESMKASDDKEIELIDILNGNVKQVDECSNV